MSKPIVQKDPLTRKPWLIAAPDVEFLGKIQADRLPARSVLRGWRPDVSGITGYTVYPTNAAQKVEDTW